MFEHLAHVFDLLEEGIGDVDGAFLSGGQGEAVAGPGVDFDDLAGEFVLLLQDQAREIGGVAQLGDDDALDGDAEAFEDALDEVVGERAFFGGLAQKHADDGAHVRFDVDDEHLLVIADETERTRCWRGGSLESELAPHRSSYLITV